jgi:ComF family protein
MSWRATARCASACRLTDFAVLRPVAALARAVLDVLVPPQCPTCDQLVSIATPAFSRARAAFRYDVYARRLILPFKHADRTEHCDVLATHMARAGAALLRDADVLVPVPLHRRRLRRRRYNQAALLARALARASGLQVIPDALERLRPTPPLGGQSATERHATVDGAFAVRPRRAGRIAGRRVVLIDDVMTSGATANACAAALRAAGAADVMALVAARVPDPRLA